MYAPTPPASPSGSRRGLGATLRTSAPSTPMRTSSPSNNVGHATSNGSGGTRFRASATKPLQPRNAGVAAGFLRGRGGQLGLKGLPFRRHLKSVVATASIIFLFLYLRSSGSNDVDPYSQIEGEQRTWTPYDPSPPDAASSPNLERRQELGLENEEDDDDDFEGFGLPILGPSRRPLPAPESNFFAKMAFVHPSPERMAELEERRLRSERDQAAREGQGVAGGGKAAGQPVVVPKAQMGAMPPIIADGVDAWDDKTKRDPPSRAQVDRDASEAHNKLTRPTRVLSEEELELELEEQLAEEEELDGDQPPDEDDEDWEPEMDDSSADEEEDTVDGVPVSQLTVETVGGVPLDDLMAEATEGDRDGEDDDDDEEYLADGQPVTYEDSYTDDIDTRYEPVKRLDDLPPWNPALAKAASRPRALTQEERNLIAEEEAQDAEQGASDDELEEKAALHAYRRQLADEAQRLAREEALRHGVPRPAPPPAVPRKASNSDGRPVADWAANIGRKAQEILPAAVKPTTQRVASKLSAAAAKGNVVSPKKKSPSRKARRPKNAKPDPPPGVEAVDEAGGIWEQPDESAMLKKKTRRKKAQRKSVQQRG